MILFSLSLLLLSTIVVTTAGVPAGNRTSGSGRGDERVQIFKADFSKSSLSAAFDGAHVDWGNANVILWASGGGIDVIYPKGSYSTSPVGTGGFGLATYHRVTNTAVLKYSVFFPADFNFVHGGKLPGLWGGKKDCSGGDIAVDCFSIRVMWREDGQGEGYLYANREAQDPAICQMPHNYCNPDYGWSLNTGAFTFKRGEWNDLEVRMTLNTLSQRNGVLSISHNGVEAIRYDNIVYRVPQYPGLVIDGLHVNTFFGGSSEYWATPTRQVTKFRDFVLLSE